MTRLVRWLERRKTIVPGLAAALAVLLCLPSLGVGLQAEDHVHAWVAHGSPGPLPTRPRLEMFSFVHDPAENAALIEAGVLPWWSRPDVKVAFFRPFAAVTHLFDHLVLRRPALMHAHSLFWLALLVLAAGCFYRRFLSSGVAGLAVLLYAVDDAHAVTAAWLANRNALIGGVLGVLALITHDRWRRDGRNGLFPPLLLAAALLSCEGAVAMLAYFVAYAAFLEPGGARRRLVSLTPAVAVVATWWIAYRVAGFGVRGTDLYVDPASLQFLPTLARRAPLLLAGQWTPVPAELSLVLPASWGPFHAAAMAAFLVPVGLALRPLLRRDATARFFALGMLGALVPAASALPMNRLLVFVGLGAMGLCARLLAEGSRPIVYALAACHLVLAPVALPYVCARTRVGVGDAIASAPAHLDGLDLVIVRAPEPFSASLLPLVRGVAGLDLPRHVRLLAATSGALSVSRPDARTLDLRRVDGDPWQEVTVVRDGLPMRVGDRVELSGFAAEVTEVARGRPVAARIRFDVPLEDPSLLWLVWDHGRLAPLSPPPVGGSLLLPDAALL